MISRSCENPATAAANDEYSLYEVNFISFAKEKTIKEVFTYGDNQPRGYCVKLVTEWGASAPCNGELKVGVRVKCNKMSGISVGSSVGPDVRTGAWIKYFDGDLYAAAASNYGQSCPAEIDGGG